MRNLRTTVAVAAVGVAAVIGGVAFAAGGASSDDPTFNASAARADVTGQATVTVATVDVQGRPESILVDSRGLPLYTYALDTATTSKVSPRLASEWPPLIATVPTARGATGALMSVRTANGEQVSYNGHFLYTFIDDRPGIVTGQGVQSFFVATADGSQPVGLPSSTTSTSANTDSGYSW